MIFELNHVKTFGLPYELFSNPLLIMNIESHNSILKTNKSCKIATTIKNNKQYFTMFDFPSIVPL